jgi:hypothetical protein
LGETSAAFLRLRGVEAPERNSTGLMATITSLAPAATIASSVPEPPMTGHYSNSEFTLAPRGGTGALVKFV